MLDIDLTVRHQVAEPEIVLKNEFKTARYSFVRPLQIGATLANRGELLPVCEQFGLAAGQLYQIQDDLLDLFGDPAETKKEALTDITQNQHTVLTAHLRATHGEAAAFLDSRIGTVPSPEDATTLRDYFVTTGAVAHAEALIDHYQKEAISVLDHPALAERERAFFADFLALIYKRRA
jgi:geranylgeranyl diphosphate synthase type I